MKAAYDAIVVLGYDVDSKGNMPKEAKNRVIKAKELFDANMANKIIFSGKLSIIHHFRPKKTEAQTMYEYGIKLGLPASAMIIEDRSRTTLKNARYTKVILDKNGWNKFIVVVGSFTIDRAKYIFTKVYGGSYSIKFITSENGLSQKALNRQKKLEKVKWIKALQTK